jgi:hypothetical protein
MSEISDLISAIREGELQTRKEMQELRLSVQTMTENFSKYWQHLAVYEEDKKNDNEFKKDVREHIKYASPLLDYVSEQKSITGKMKISFYIAVMFAVLALLGFGLG